MRYLPLILLLSCGSPSNDPAPIALPQVKTFAESTPHGVIVKCIIISGTGIAHKGYCWKDGYPYPPTLSDNATEKLIDTLQLGPGRYFFRAFAQNGAGIAYGDTIIIEL